MTKEMIGGGKMRDGNKQCSRCGGGQRMMKIMEWDVVGVFSV